MQKIVSGFDWDGGNREKCQKHGVAIRQIESLFDGPVMLLPDEAHSTMETRFRAIARVPAAATFSWVFTIRESDGKFFIRPISARHMHKGEIEHHEKENPDL